jgi:hypothetical protein
MLPGFRFLFGALVLSLSVLVFGLGAAALLRTAHEEFASAPAWRPAPETRFAQTHDTSQAAQPVLALLRVDDAPKDTVKDTIRDTLKDTDKEAATVEPPVLNDAPVNAVADPATVSSPRPDPDKTAALQPSDMPPSAATAPEAAMTPSPSPENPPQPEAIAAPDEATAANDQTRLATAAQPSTDAPAPVTTGAAPIAEATRPPAAEAAPAVPQPTSDPAAASFSTRIATLGGPPVSIRPAKAVSSPKAAAARLDKDKEDKDELRKRQARRAAHRRRLAALRLQQQQLTAQQALNPFGQASVGQAPAGQNQAR